MAKRKVFGLFHVKEGVVNGSIINFISIKYEGEGRRNLEEDRDRFQLFTISMNNTVAQALVSVRPYPCSRITPRTFRR